MDLANVSEGFKNFMFDLKDWINETVAALKGYDREE